MKESGDKAESLLPPFVCLIALNYQKAEMELMTFATCFCCYLLVRIENPRIFAAAFINPNSPNKKVVSALI